MNIRILVVDDHAVVRQGYAALLRVLLPEVQVIEACDGEEALRMFRRHSEELCLAVVDVIMPGLDGPSWVGKALETRPGTRTVFMSGYAEEQLRKSIDIDNVNFLPKPFSVQELAEAVRKTLSEN